ncbi:ABC-type amino acid transport substrate-binding protein [Inhella inkyongensis]|uniref:ABC-type amino acid transport substrate-binding protein n=1 Tax=Inhella inkyongensis TaxID=392593 RepID=A0A840S4Q2_9BURK|nr:transporter substrate-binding domain-containing protein [Inhella inkyongensis]MBB5203804.1 ABC-type amino acid transport substrate-binding protein [Inhella inkyongensis]
MARKRRGLGALLLALGLGSAAQAWTLLVPSNHSLPLAEVQGSEVKRGILVELGQALARELSQPVRFVVRPSRRVGEALRKGEADLLCYALPEWIDGEFQWTQAVIPNAAVIAARRDSPAIRQLSDLANRSVGTVLGYRHLEMDQPLGAQFQRSDALDMQGNLAKLAARRTDFAITDRLTLQHLNHRHTEWALEERLVMRPFEAACALSPRSQLNIQTLRLALRKLQSQGQLDRLLQPRSAAPS